MGGLAIRMIAARTPPLRIRLPPPGAAAHALPGRGSRMLRSAQKMPRPSLQEKRGILCSHPCCKKVKKPKI